MFILKYKKSASFSITTMNSAHIFVYVILIFSFFSRQDNYSNVFASNFFCINNVFALTQCRCFLLRVFQLHLIDFQNQYVWNISKVYEKIIFIFVSKKNTSYINTAFERKNCDKTHTREASNKRYIDNYFNVLFSSFCFKRSFVCLLNVSSTIFYFIRENNSILRWQQTMNQSMSDNHYDQFFLKHMLIIQQKKLFSWFQKKIRNNENKNE